MRVLVVGERVNRVLLRYMAVARVAGVDSMWWEIDAR